MPQIIDLMKKGSVFLTNYFGPGETKEYSFKEYGSCSMWKERMEKATLKTKGVRTAKWNKKNNMLKVTSDEKICFNTLHKNIAKAGHDPEKEN